MAKRRFCFRPPVVINCTPLSALSFWVSLFPRTHGYNKPTQINGKLSCVQGHRRLLNVHFTQSNIQMLSKPGQSANGIFHRNRRNILNICVETQRLLNSQRHSEKIEQAAGISFPDFTWYVDANSHTQKKKCKICTQNGHENPRNRTESPKTTLCAGVQHRQDPGVPSGWMALVRERERDQTWGVQQSLANLYFFYRSFYILS